MCVNPLILLEIGLIYSRTSGLNYTAAAAAAAAVLKFSDIIDKMHFPTHAKSSANIFRKDF